jgi:hypothetical protein
VAIVISDDVVLSAEEVEAGVNDNNPRIGWHNLVTSTNVTSDEEAAGFSVVNVANPATYLKWKGETTGVQTVTVDLGSADEINYFGIVGHNFGTDGTNIKLQRSSNGSAWTDVTSARVLANDYAYMEEFADVNYRYYRLHLTPATLVPQLAVFYIGRVLRVQRRLYVGHKPATLNRKTTVSSGFSETGQFLGRVKRRQMLEGKADFKNITPDWYRETFDPFVAAAEEVPWFWAWRPGAYPEEVGFMWLDGDPDVGNDLPNGMMNFSISMTGMR